MQFTILINFYTSSVVFFIGAYVFLIVRGLYIMDQQCVVLHVIFIIIILL